MGKFFKNITPCLVVISLMVVVLFVKKTSLALAAYVPLPDPNSFGNPPAPSGASGTDQAINLVKAFYQNTKYIIGSIAVGMLTYSGFRLVTARGKEEVINVQKDYLFWAIVGLAIISIAEAASQVLSFENGTPIQDPQTIAKRAILFSENTYLVISFIKYIIGSVAVLFIVRAGAKLITAGYSEEVINQEKKNLYMGLISLAGIMIADTVVNEIIYKLNPNVNYQSNPQPAIDASRGVAEIIGITNFIVTFVGPVAIFMLIVGAIYYLIAMGEDDKVQTARKIIFNALLGIIIIYGSFAIVSTFVGGSIDYTP